jgi:hypothetical protein
LTPSLTTISQHGVEIGEVAAKLLIDRLESKKKTFLMKQLSLKQNKGKRVHKKRVIIIGVDTTQKTICNFKLQMVFYRFS